MLWADLIRPVGSFNIWPRFLLFVNKYLLSLREQNLPLSFKSKLIQVKFFQVEECAKYRKAKKIILFKNNSP